MIETVDLYFKKLGNGPAVVILHGLFGSSDNWQTLARKLSEDYTVYLLDQRNHGRSPHHTEMNYTVMAADLHAFLQKEKLENPVLIGHSMGGKTVMTFAQQYSYPLGGLISVDMGIKAYKGDHGYLFEAMLSMPIDSIESRGEAREYLGARIKSEGVLLFLLKNIQRDSKGGYSWKINLPVIWKNYSNLMKGLGSDTVDTRSLFLYGEVSNYVQKSDYASIRDVFSQAEFQGIEEAGHWVHAEKPSETLSAFRHFLEAVHY